MTVDIAWLGVLLAMVVAFAVNMTWFSMKGFYGAWQRALGSQMLPVDTPPTGMVLPFSSVLIALFAQAVAIDWVLQAVAALYEQDISLWAGLLTGAVMGVSFAAATSLGHRIFAGQGFKVWAIEVGADVLGLALMGAVLSFWR
jgi:hypothetical protein